MILPIVMIRGLQLDAALRPNVPKLLRQRPSTCRIASQVLEPSGSSKSAAINASLAMTMVKLPNLDGKEMSWIIQAMERYCPDVHPTELEAYQHLLAMLKRRELGNQD